MLSRFCSNQSIGFVVASRFTSVGRTRQSMGPAMSVRLAGVAGCSSSAITAVAASAATQGWQIATTCVPGPMAAVKSTRCCTYSSRPKRPAASGTSRALCQSVTCTSWSASMVRTVSRRSVAKWPDIGATKRTRGPRAPWRLRKRRRVPKGVAWITSSSTGTGTPSMTVSAMPQGGRQCVTSARLNTSYAAPSRRRVPSTGGIPGAASSNAGAAARARLRRGHSASA